MFISVATLFLYSVPETKDTLFGDDFIYVSQLRLYSCSNFISVSDLNIFSYSISVTTLFLYQNVKNPKTLFL
jgi:hypothetical protein